MGLQISELVIKKDIVLEDLKGKILAVDAFNTLYQFLANIRQKDGTPLMDHKQRITSHLSGLFYRTINLMAFGIKLIYVFDGIAPELKGETLEKREERKEEAAIKFARASEKHELEAMYKYSKQMIRLSDYMIDESKKLVGALGMPYVQAPSEGEAQAAHMAKHDHDIYAVASQDYDALLFGAPRLIQNVSFARKRRLASGAFTEVQPELIELERVLNHLQITHEQLIALGILVGTDFNQGGVKGIGPKKALELVRRRKQPVLIFNEIEKMADEGKVALGFDWHEIFEIFKKPEITKDYKIKFSNINEKEVRKLLCDEHDFSEERVSNALAKAHEHKEKAQQHDLKRWF